MAYQVLARKWRPQTFAEVLGQAHITTTLQNAIARGRVGHAYLFVGSRGIGKTTSARIFAKALNCETPAKDAAGRIEPCCSCGTCKEIAAGSCLDVIEIDGASHNGVDDIRELRETVQYTPTHGRTYKVYIIDEVHMLSAAAWNALLKTLEEPPPHVKFLFATTEAHKVLPTILSRCQRFDLKRIEASIIAARLRDIAGREDVHIDDEAIQVMARAADGGMRDGQSIFDQMIAFCGGMDESERITESDVIDVFGLASRDELNALVGALLVNDPGSLMNAVHHLADRGRNLERLYADLLEALRNLMIYQVARDPSQILDQSATEAQDTAAMAKSCSPAVVQRLVEGLLSGDSGIRHTLNKRVYIETQLMRSMREAHALRLDDVIGRLRKLHEGGNLDDMDELAAPARSAQQMPANVPARPAAPPSQQSRPASEVTAAAPPAPDRLLRQEPADDVVALSAAVAAAPAEPAPAAEPAPLPAAATMMEADPTPAAPVAEEPVGVPGDFHGPPAQPMATRGGDERPASQDEDDRRELIASRRADDDAPIPEPPGDYDDGYDEMDTPMDSVPPLPGAAASTAIWEKLGGHPVVQELCDLFAGRLVDVRGIEAADGTA